MTERLAGALFALLYLSGRFSLADSDAEATLVTLLYQVRFWTLLILAAIAITYCPPRRRLLLGSSLITSPLTISLAVLLPLYVASSILWSLNVVLSHEKAVEAGLLALACLCFVPFLREGRIPAVRNWFWIALVVTTGLMCLMAIFAVNSTRMSVLGGGPNTFGRNMGLLFLGSLYLQRRSSASNAWCWYPMLAASFLMVVLSGSRGALLATTVGSFIYLIIDSRYRTRNLIAVGCLLIMTQFLVFSTEMGDRVLEMFRTRILDLTFERQYMSGREDLYAAAFELGLEHPWFGHGLSGFTILLGYNYPHNIALELFSETGLVGVALLLCLLFALLRFVVRHRHHCDPAIWGAFGLTLSSAMFSGDFYDSRGVLLMAMLGAQEIIAVRPANPRIVA
jgi:O-antigen ligase